MPKFKYIISLIILLSGCVTIKPFEGDKKMGKAIVASEVLDQHFKGLIIKDLESNETIFSWNGTKLFTPASNTKVVTFYITDLMLPDSIPAIKYCRIEDTLHFQAMGDPTLLYPGFKQQPLINFLSANQHLVYSSPITEIERFGPGWAWDDYPYYFQPEKSSLPIYGNCLWVKKDTPDITYHIFPKKMGKEINIEFEENHDFSIHRDEYSNSFTIIYDALPQNIERCIPFKYTDSLALTLLEDTVQKSITKSHFLTSCEQQIFYTYPKDSLFKPLLVNSDNFIAEQLLINASAYLFDTLSTSKSIQFAFDNFLRDWQDSVRWVDGSGLSRYNAMSPAFMVDVLERIYHKNGWQRITALFPDGGKEGTLDNFLFEEEPFIFAKSGSMTGVYNLSGYIITDRCKTLAFSFMNNNIKCSFSELKTEMERILRLIKANY